MRSKLISRFKNKVIFPTVINPTQYTTFRQAKKHINLKLIFIYLFVTINKTKIQSLNLRRMRTYSFAYGQLQYIVKLFLQTY